MKRESTAVFGARARSAFRKFVLDPEFSCLGGEAAINEKAYRFGTFAEMGTKEATRELSYQLFDFAHSAKMKGKQFSSFVAVFGRPLELTEREFEVCLWLQLRRLHLVDPSEWDSKVNADPANPHFAFSFGGQGFYVVGMHANSSRAARRFRWPALVFNPHEQFERLHSDGNWKRMQHAVREREVALQGTVNPMVSEFGEKSEARQYSGRAVSDKWTGRFLDLSFRAESRNL